MTIGEFENLEESKLEELLTLLLVSKRMVKDQEQLKRSFSNMWGDDQASSSFLLLNAEIFRTYGFTGGQITYFQHIRGLLEGIFFLPCSKSLSSPPDLIIFFFQFENTN